MHLNTKSCIESSLQKHILSLRFMTYQRPMSIEQSMTLKGAYTAIKTKLLIYERHVKRKPIFPIATMLTPSLKFEYIPTNDQEYITKTLKYLLQLMPAPPISSAFSQSEPLSHFVRRGIVTYEREKLYPRTISILMTLKSWGKKDEANSDKEEFGEDTD